MDSRPEESVAPAMPDFAAWVAERRPALLRAARAITRDHHTAEDLLQTTLTKVCAHWDRIRDPRALDSYVRRAMVNQYATWYRQPWQRRERPTDVLPEPGPVEGDSWDVPRPGREHALWPLVAALPPRQRSAVVLRYYEGLSEAEVSSVLRCSRGTVKSNTSRGLSTLRRWALEADLDLAG